MPAAHTAPWRRRVPALACWWGPWCEGIGITGAGQAGLAVVGDGCSRNLRRANAL